MELYLTAGRISTFLRFCLKKNAAILWKKHKICMLSQIPDCSEYTLKEALSSSYSFTAAMKELLSNG